MNQAEHELKQKVGGPKIKIKIERHVSLYYTWKALHLLQTKGCVESLLASISQVYGCYFQQCVWVCISVTFW